MNTSINNAGNVVSSFWMSYMIGMWFFSVIIKFFCLKRVFILLTSISTMLMSFFLYNTNYLILQISIIGLGFFSSAIYTIIITLSSLQTKNPSPKLINIILLCGTIGTLLTFIVTSPIVKYYGLYASLISSNIFYAIVFFLSILIYFNSKNQKF